MIKPGFDIKGLATGAIALFVGIVMFPSLVTALQTLAENMIPRLYALAGVIGLCAIPIGVIVHHSPGHKILGREISLAGLIAVVVAAAGAGTALSIGHFGAGILHEAAGKL